MGRRAKPASEYLRSRATAAYLADHVQVPRTGHSLARWFEKTQGLPKGSVDEKSWRRFLSGHQPHHARLERVFQSAPAVRALYEHPIWDAVSLICTESRSITILDSFGWQKQPNTNKQFWPIIKLSELDQLTCLAAMLNNSCRNSCILNIGERLCVAYVEVTGEYFWNSFALELLTLLRVKLANKQGIVLGLTEMEISYAQRFWSLIKKDFFKNESSASYGTWAAWREAVYSLGWEERDELKFYIEAREEEVLPSIHEDGRKVYNKVRSKMYRLLRKCAIGN